MKGRWLLLTALAAGLGLYSLAQPSPPRVLVGGSTSFLPLAERAATLFRRTHPDLRVEFFGGGSRMGLSQVAQGTLDLALSDLPDQPTGLQSAPLGRVPLAIVVPRRAFSPVVNRRILAALFGGRESRWSRLGGPDAPVLVVTRARGSGTREAVRSFLFGVGDFPAETLVVSSNGAMARAVADTPGAIGYLEVGALTPDLTALRVEGLEPGAAGYPLRLPGRVFWHGSLSPVARAYLDALQDLARRGWGVYTPAPGR